MLFYVKKIMGYLLEPFSLICLLLLISWYLIDGKKHLKIKIILFVCIFALIALSTPFISNKLVNYYITNTTQIDEIYYNDYKDIKYIVILGGVGKERAWEGVRLFYMFKQQDLDVDIIATGYKDGATTTQELLLSANIPQENIITFTAPKTTNEEAIAIKNFLSNQTFVLTTSNYHIKRAVAIFKAHNLKFITSSDNSSKIEKYDIAYLPRLKYLSTSRKILHEILGLWYFRLKIYFLNTF